MLAVQSKRMAVLSLHTRTIFVALQKPGEPLRFASLTIMQPIAGYTAVKRAERAPCNTCSNNHYCCNALVTYSKQYPDIVFDNCCYKLDVFAGA
jgi:hypothetical protein